MFEGLLVDLVPYNEMFEDRDHDWYNGEGTFFWSMGGRWINTQTQIEQMHEWLRKPETRHHRIGFGVLTRPDAPEPSRPIGYFGLHRLMLHHRVAMLSAMIGEPDYWGGGYGTDALLLIVDYAFDWLDMRRLWLKTMTHNARVLRQMEKVGLVREVLERDGTWVNNGWGDAVCYGLLREEWPGRAAMIERLGLRAKNADKHE